MNAVFLKATGSALNLAGIFSSIRGLVLAILAFGFLIFIHELGHYIMAKRAGVKVNEFALGMGPKIFSIKKGETDYTLRLLPIGGFVSMEGENEESADSHAFSAVSIGNRALISVAGAVMNLLLGLLLMGILTSIQLSDENALIPTNQIGDFHEGASTSQWLEPGDIILKMNRKTVRNYTDITNTLVSSKTELVHMVVERDGQVLELPNVVFDRQEVQEGVYILTLDFRPVGVTPTFLRTISFSLERTLGMTKQIWGSFVDLVTGRLSVNHLSGPVGITKEMSNLTVEQDWMSFFFFIAMLSLNLGVLNLLPFPPLDGGRLLFLLIEKITGKVVNQNFEVIISLLGMALLLGLMVVVSIKDIGSLFK